MTKLVRYFAILMVLAINGGAISYIVFSGMNRGNSYHRTFVIAAVLQIAFECFVVETIEWLWVYGITPLQMEPAIRNAVAVLRNCVFITFVGLEHEAVNVPEYFFVSTKIAKSFPHLIDSTVVLSYETQYLRHLSPTWRHYIDEWVDRNWDVDIDYALRFLYILFQKCTILRCGGYLSLYIGTLPIILQRLAIRVFGFLFLGSIYIAARFRHNKSLWYIIGVSVWAGHEIIAWYCRKRESNKVSVMVPKDRERNNIQPLLFSPLAKTPVGAGKSPIRNNPTPTPAKQTVSKPSKYSVTPSTVGNFVDSNYTNPVAMYGACLQEEKDEEGVSKLMLNSQTSSQLLVASHDIEKCNLIERSISSSLPASINSTPVRGRDILHVSLDDNEVMIQRKDDMEDNADIEADSATIDDDDDDYSRFYPSLQRRVEIEYSDVINAIDDVLIHSDSENE